MHPPSPLQPRVSTLHFLEMASDQRHFRGFLERDEPGPDPIIDVMIVVGDLVCEVGELRLQPRLLRLSRKRCPISPSSRALDGAQCLRMPSRHSKVRFSPGKSRVALFELIDRAQRLQVVLKAAVVPHAVVQCVLAGVAKGRVPQIMSQRDGFGQGLVERSARAIERAICATSIEWVTRVRNRSPS